METPSERRPRFTPVRPRFGNHQQSADRPERLRRSGRRYGQRQREPVFVSVTDVDYKDIARLRRCIDEQGKILPRRRLGHSVQVQHGVTVAIKRARHMALLPFSRAQARD